MIISSTAAWTTHDEIEFFRTHLLGLTPERVSRINRVRANCRMPPTTKSAILDDYLDLLKTRRFTQPFERSIAVETVSSMIRAARHGSQIAANGHWAVM